MTSWRWRAPRWCPCPRVRRPRARGRRRNRGTRGRTQAGPALGGVRFADAVAGEGKKSHKELFPAERARGRGWRTTRMRSGL